MEKGTTQGGGEQGREESWKIYLQLVRAPHHMAWTVHKPADCLLGKQRKDEQKKPKANSATVAAAATSAMNPHFASLLAAMANLDQNE